MKTYSLALSSFLLTSCAGVPGAKPDDMSASAHQAEAKRHTELAEAHQAQFDPDAVKWDTRFESETDAYDLLPEYYYNPTKGHLTQAEKHLDHAKAHRAAAAELKAFVREECAGFMMKTRAQCPLLGGVREVTDIDGGVRFVVSDGVDPAGLVAHMQCHFAVGRATGRKGMPSCPLYLKELSVRRVGDQAVELTSTDELVVPELRRRIRTHVVEGHAHHP